MSKPTAGNTSGGTGGVERRRVQLDLLLRRLDHERSTSNSWRSGGGRGRGRDPAESHSPRGGGGVEEGRDERFARFIGERH